MSRALIADMLREVERLRQEYGLAPVRYLVGGGAMLTLSPMPLRPAAEVDGLPSVAALSGTPVVLDPTMAWDEWAPVFRGSR